jgi:outer membrane murein-binding lipoprotein Lpp
MASPQENGPPTSVANITPPTGEGQARTAFEAFKDTLSEIRKDVRELRLGLVVGFLILGGMLIAGYWRLEAKIDDLATSQTRLETSLVRVETKLDDALQRNASPPPPKLGAP